ncbi:hypothetical protein P4829_01885 [Bacillus atrophaeus]|nr:hypothetical protein [Bacillus atrophaeus]WFE14564.1 hypothetical protein P4829_01885 [Bacillus atrophaeus]
MKQTRRIVLLMLAVILPASLMAACSQQHHETEQASSETSKSNEKGETVSAKEKQIGQSPQAGNILTLNIKIPFGLMCLRKNKRLI